MPYDLKTAIKKVGAKPVPFVLIEGKKSRMVIILPKPPVVKEVQESCGSGKQIAKGVCQLENGKPVFKTKAAPQPAWTSHVNKLLSGNGCGSLVPAEFRQLGEEESDEGEAELEEGSSSSETTVPPTTPPAPTGRARSGAVSGEQARPVFTTPPVTKAWTSAKPTGQPPTSPGVTIGTKTAPEKPAPTGQTGGWKPAVPSALAQAKADFDKRFKGIVPRYQKKLTPPERETEKERLFKEAGAKAGTKDWKGAHAALDALEVLVGIDLGPDAPSLAEGVEDLHKRAGLHTPAIARNTAAAREAATRLVKPDGTLDGAFDTLLDEIATQPTTPQKKQLTKTLNKLKNDPALRDKISAIPKPDPKNPANGFIRASLGLKKDEEVTAAHARQAAVAALLAEMRQNDVGSCFGTSVAIRVHDTQPGRFLDDMVQLMTTGKLTRTVNGEKIEVPISPKMSTGSIDRKLRLKRTGAKVGTDVDLHATPGFSASLGTLGIAPEKQKEAVEEALVALRASKSVKIKAALAKLPPEVNAATRKKLERVALEALRDKPDSDVKALIGEVTKDLTDPQKLAATAACDAYDTATEDDLAPEDVFRQIAMKRAGLTEEDLLLREKMQALAPKVRALQGDMSPAAQKVFNEYSQVADKVLAKRDKLEQLDQELEASRETYLGQQDNRLLRAWEYTVSSMAEKGLTKRQTQRLTTAATKTVNDELDTILTKTKATASPSAKGKLDTAAPKLKAKFDELFKARIQSGYDASVQGELSADGSSDRGAFALFDTTGATDPADWLKISDERVYADVVSGLMMEAWLELYGKEPDEELRKQSRLLADQLAESARSTGFIKAASDNTKAQYGGEDQKPWQAVRGNFSEFLLPVYYEQDGATAMAANTPANPGELMNFIVGNMKTMWSGIKDGVAADGEGASVPLNNGPHAFLLKPGSPALKAAAESGDDASTWAAKRETEEKKKAKGQRETELTPAIKASLYEELLGTNSAKDRWIAAVDSKLGPNPTIEDFHNAFQDSAAGDAGKAYFKEQLAYAMTRAVLPPVAPGDVEKLITKALEKLNVPEEKREAVKNKARTTALAGTPASASMAVIEKAVAAALKSEGVKPDEAAAATEVNAALRSAAEPPGLVFADSNWGGGDHHIVFSMVTNPITEELEMWQMNEDGSAPRKLATDKWVTTQWRMPTSPTAFGGV